MYRSMGLSGEAGKGQAARQKQEDWRKGAGLGGNRVQLSSKGRVNNHTNLIEFCIGC